MTLKEFAEKVSEAAKVSPEAEVVVWDENYSRYVEAQVSPTILYAERDTLWKYVRVFYTKRNGSTSLFIIK